MAEVMVVKEQSKATEISACHSEISDLKLKLDTSIKETEQATSRIFHQEAEKNKQNAERQTEEEKLKEVIQGNETEHRSKETQLGMENKKSLEKLQEQVF